MYFQTKIQIESNMAFKFETRENKDLDKRWDGVDFIGKVQPIFKGKHV